MADAVNDYHKQKYPGYRERIANCIKKAKRFPVDAECGIVHEFLT